MNEKLIETQSNLIKQAETELIQSNQLLESLQQEKGLQEESDLDELDSLKSLLTQPPEYQFFRPLSKILT